MSIRVTPARTIRIAPALGVALAVTFALTLGLATEAYAQSPHSPRSAKSSTCVVCHAVHSASSVMLTRASYPTAHTTALCVSCHDGSNPDGTNVTAGSGNSFGQLSGHTLDPGATGPAAVAGCETCHDIHMSTDEARMLPTRQLNGKLNTSAGTNLCISCHDSDDSWFGAQYPSTTRPSRDETGYPIAGTWPGPETYLDESNAHRLLPATMQKTGVSEPVGREQGDCRYCHASHGAANAYDSLVTTFTVPVASTLERDQVEGSYAALCLKCHGGSTPNGFSEAPTNVGQFVTGPAGKGHRVKTAGGMLPVGAPLPCFECHNPHGSKRGNSRMISDERGGSLSTSSAAGVRSFCFTCHTTADNGTGWDSDQSAYAQPDPSATVVGLPRSGGVLRLPTSSGHTESDDQSCYDCHGRDYQAGGYNVHNPSAGSSPAVAPVETSQLPSIEPTSSTEMSGTVIRPAEGADESTALPLPSDPTSAAPETPGLPDDRLPSPSPPWEDSLPLTGTAGLMLGASDGLRRTARRR